MAESLTALRRRHTGVLLLNLLYFLTLLALGILFFLKGFGGVAAYALAALCAAGYLLLVRPARNRYIAAVREAILRHTVCAGLDGLAYQPKGGVAAEDVQASELFSISHLDAFMSREHITGQAGPVRVKLADVTFPIVENGLNAMFSGAFVELTWPGAALPEMTVRAGEPCGVLPKRQLALVKELGELIPGSLYLQSGGGKLTLLLRGRFLGFPVNPLLPVNDRSLRANPFPELEQALRLIRLMGQNTQDKANRKEPIAFEKQEL